jgi:uncharacterized membrane protein
MESYLLEWANLMGRWLHMITGIAWIGASFYFVWLDNHLQTPAEKTATDRGVSGEVWSVHGGGFYHAQKYLNGPPILPPTLHWFKWEAYTTFLSGLFMLALIYWYGAEIYTIDPDVMALSKPVAIGIGIATLVIGWLVYDWLCRSVIGKDAEKLGLALFIFICLVAYSLCQVFSGRAAFIHFGAMLGTIMVANVYFIIMPGQAEMVEASKVGKTAEPIHGIRAKQRSVHNTYFTLPVLFVMISNHYAMTFSNSYNWLILVTISLMGAFIRIYFVARHEGKASLLPLAVAVALLVGVILLAAPKPAPPTTEIEIDFSEVKQIISTRCTSCHSQTPTQPGFASAPNGVMFDTKDQILSKASQIHQQVVVKAMPIGNLTQMTDQERAKIASWFDAGAKP